MWSLFFTFVFAQEKSAFEQMLEQNTEVETRENWVEIHGQRYRQIEYRGTRYYLKMQGRTGEIAQLNCDIGTPAIQPRLLEAHIQVFRRTRLFVDALWEKCRSWGGQQETQLMIDPRFGFTLPDDPKSVIKSKKIFYSPASGLGFSGEW